MGIFPFVEVVMMAFWDQTWKLWMHDLFTHFKKFYEKVLVSLGFCILILILCSYLLGFFFSSTYFTYMVGEGVGILRILFHSLLFCVSIHVSGFGFMSIYDSVTHGIAYSYVSLQSELYLLYQFVMYKKASFQIKTDSVFYT